MQTLRRQILALAGMLVIMGGSGCAREKPKNATWQWPWQPEVDDAVGITTPTQRIEELQKLCIDADKKSPAEKDVVVASLVKQIDGEQDPLLRRHIIRTAGFYKTPTSTAILKAALNDSDTEVRITCCEAWGRQGGKAAVEALSGTLTGDTNVDVRLAAARAIGRTRDASALAPLAEALTDADPAIQYRVAASLKQVSGKDFGADPALWRAYAKGESVKEPTVSVAERLRRLF